LEVDAETFEDNNNSDEYDLLTYFLNSWRTRRSCQLLIGEVRFCYRLF